MSIDTAKLKAAAQGALQPHERLGALPTNDIFDISLAEGTQLDADITAVNAFHDESTPAKILELIAALEAKDAQIAELLEKQRLIDICQGQGLEHRIAAERRAEAAEKRVAELEESELQLMEERDNAEEALADMYQAATGERPEWSNWFGYADAIDAVTDRVAELEAN